jgi:hypothetical protein
VTAGVAAIPMAVHTLTAYSVSALGSATGDAARSKKGKKEKKEKKSKKSKIEKREKV